MQRGFAGERVGGDAEAGDGGSGGADLYDCAPGMTLGMRTVT